MSENRPIPKRKPNVIGVTSKKEPEGLGLSFKDGWSFGSGFGLAMAIVVPVILVLIGCIAIFALAFFGSSLGALL